MIGHYEVVINSTFRTDSYVTVANTYLLKVQKSVFVEIMDTYPDFKNQVKAATFEWDAIRKRESNIEYAIKAFA